MSQRYEYRPIDGDERLAALGEIVGRSYAMAPADWETWHRGTGPEVFRGFWSDGTLIGGLAVYPCGQWFGGRSVPMWGVGGVAIAPERRAHGAAREMMRECLTEMRSQGCVLSTLYPSTQHLYRSVGYEQAGTLARLSFASSALAGIRGTLPARRVPSDAAPGDTARALYGSFAREENGLLDRTPTDWRFLVSGKAGSVDTWLLGDEGREEGYLITWIHEKDEMEIVARDLVALTPEAVRTALAFLHSHRSQIGKVVLRVPLHAPLLLLLREQAGEVEFCERWHTRIVDLTRALSGRGYAQGVTGELHLEVRDELFAENAGRFVLRVHDGAGVVERGGRGDLKADIGGLAPLYTGFIPARKLRALGLLEGDPTSLATAEQLFAGPAPWLPDFF